MRTLSVRERVLQAVHARYQAIQSANQYNTTVTAVRRYRVLPERAETAAEIWLVMDDGQYSYRSDTMLWCKVPVHVFFVLDTESPDVDTEFNLFLADIERASCLVDVDGVVRSAFRVESQGTPLFRDAWAEIQDNRSYYGVVQAGQCVGRLTFLLTWSQLIANPFLFDDQDVTVTV